MKKKEINFALYGYVKTKPALGWNDFLILFVNLQKNSKNANFLNFPL